MARSPYDKERNYLHPVQTPKFRTSDFQRMETGKTADGTRIERVRATNPAIREGYRDAVYIHPPGNAPPMLVYGPSNEIHQIGQRIKADIDGVMKTLRPLGSSQTYSLNGPAPAETHKMPSEHEVNSYKTAKAIFPTHGRDNEPLSNEQIERRALKEHTRDLAESKERYPTSSDGAERVETTLNPKSAQSQILFDD